MLDVIMVVPLPVSGWTNVVDRESFLDPQTQLPMERMVGNLPALVESLEWIKQINPDRDPPCRLMVVINGGIPEDFVEIESYLKGIDFDWHVIHSTAVEPEARCVELALNETRHDLIALVPGTTVVRESKWMEKMQVVFMKDRNACMVGTAHGPDNNFPPYKLPRAEHPNGGLVLLKRNIVEALKWADMDGYSPLGWQISEQIAEMRGNRWVAPSVRFSDQEWASTTQERSVTTTPSE